MSEPRTPDEIIARIQLDEDDGLDIFEIMQRYRTDGSCEHTIRERLEGLPAMARRAMELESQLESARHNIRFEQAERDKLVARVVELEDDNKFLKAKLSEDVKIMLDRISERDRLAAQLKAAEQNVKILNQQRVEYASERDKLAAQVEELKQTVAARQRFITTAERTENALRKELAEAKEAKEEAESELEDVLAAILKQGLLANAPEEGANG